MHEALLHRKAMHHGNALSLQELRPFFEPCTLKSRVLDATDDLIAFKGKDTLHKAEVGVGLKLEARCSSLEECG